MDTIGALCLLHNRRSSPVRHANPSSEVTAKAKAEDRLEYQVKTR
jgi:hypothetical protein